MIALRLMVRMNGSTSPPTCVGREEAVGTQRWDAETAWTLATHGFDRNGARRPKSAEWFGGAIAGTLVPVPSRGREGEKTWHVQARESLVCARSSKT
jgi:hypothetical protein